MRVWGKGMRGGMRRDGERRGVVERKNVGEKEGKRRDEMTHDELS